MQTVEPISVIDPTLCSPECITFGVYFCNGVIGVSVLLLVLWSTRGTAVQVCGPGRK